MVDTENVALTPAAVLGAASESVRQFAHLVDRHFTERAGWEYVSDAYDCLGALAELAGRLPHVYELLLAAVRDQQELDLLGVEEGDPHAGDPAGAVEALSGALDRARVAAQQMYAGLTAAQSALSGVSTLGSGSGTPGEG